MISILKNISLFLVIGAAVNIFSLWINSLFLIQFLEKNLITLLFALLAINTTTMSVVMVKLRELKDKFNIDFKSTLNSFKHSVYEQVILIPVSVSIFIIKDSCIVREQLTHSEFILDSVLISTFTYAVHILFDNARAIFIIINYENKS